jgi:hypothetical protein
MENIGPLAAIDAVLAADRARRPSHHASAAVVVFPVEMFHRRSPSKNGAGVATSAVMIFV